MPKTESGLNRTLDFKNALKELSEKVTDHDGDLAGFAGVLLLDHGDRMEISLAAWPRTTESQFSPHFLLAYLLAVGLGTALEALTDGEEGILHSLYRVEDDDEAGRILDMMKHKPNIGNGGGYIN